MNLIESLKNCEIFKNMDDKLIDFISKMGVVKNFSPEELLFFEGEKGEYFYILMDGLVKLFKSAEDGKEIIIRLVKPGESFAEVILFEKDNYPVSAIASRDSRAFLISKSNFSHMISNRDFSFNFTAMLFKKMRYLAEKVKSLSAYDVEERFIRFLVDHYGLHESIEVNLSKKEMASAIGTIPETFSRMIKRLKKKEIITWEENLIKIDLDYVKSIMEW